MAQHITGKAIETRYRGHRYRSRLEARWAVFFDVAGIAFEYEKEGFELRDDECGVTRYLPDFWLPEQRCFAEIKGDAPSAEDIEKAWLLQQTLDKPVYLFHGQIRLPEGDQPPTAACAVLRTPVGLALEEGAWFWTQCPICERMDIVRGGTMLDLPCRCTDALWNDAYRQLLYADTPEAFDDDRQRSPLGSWIAAKCDVFQRAYDTPLLMDAYRAARYARFEYGEGR